MSILRRLITEWIIDRSYSFNEVESKSFQNIIEYLDATAISKLPKTGDTIHADIIKYFKQAREIINE